MKERIKSAFLILITRNLIGIGLSFCSMALILWQLGAQDYAPIVLTQALFFYVTMVGSLGLDILILRSNRTIAEYELEGVYTLHLVATSVGLVIAVLVAGFALEVDPLLAGIIAASYGIKAIALIPNAVLENSMRFAVQAKSEVVGQIIYIIVLLILLPMGAGAIGVAVGLLASAVFYAYSVYSLRPVRPRLHVSAAIVSRYAGQGVLLQYNTWIWQVHDVAIPIVLRAAGADAFLGAYGMASQITQKFGFFRQVVWLVAIPSIAGTRCLDERAAGVEKGTRINALVTSIMFHALFIVIVLLAKYIGERWSLVAHSFAPIAAFLLLNSVFSIYCAGLVVDGRLRALAIFHSVFVGLFLMALLVFSLQGDVNALLLSEFVAAASYLYLAREARESFRLEGLSYALVLAVSSVAVICLGMVIGSAWPSALWLLLVGFTPEFRNLVAEGFRLTAAKIQPSSK